MVVKCEDVWREISNYIEGDLDPALKRAMEEHFAQCRHCESVREGMRNVIDLYGDKTMFTVPAGFYPRLHGRLADHVEGKRVSRRAWLVSVGVIVDGGKTFHVPGCPFMHGKYRMVTPEEAIREGYNPCNRCMYEALRSA